MSESQTPAPETPDPEYKWLRVEVTRVQGTEVYLKVPKDFDHKRLSSRLLAEAIKATVDDWEWDDDGWEETVEWQYITPVTQKEAEEYRLYEVPQAAAEKTKNE